MVFFSFDFRDSSETEDEFDLGGVHDVVTSSRFLESAGRNSYMDCGGLVVSWGSDQLNGWDSTNQLE